jgi:predicted ATP-dependent endonuclease of OLD family
MEVPKGIMQLVKNFENYYNRSQNYNKKMINNNFVKPFFTYLGWSNEDLGKFETTKKFRIFNGNYNYKAPEKPDYCFSSDEEKYFFLSIAKISDDIKTDRDLLFNSHLFSWSKKLNFYVLTNFKELGIYISEENPEITNPLENMVKLYNFKEYENKWEEIYESLSKEAVLKKNLKNRLKDSKMKDIIIKDLVIASDSYNYKKNAKLLRRLSKINIFIGRNNSGKSRFLRSIFCQTNSTINYIVSDNFFYYHMDNILNFYEKIELIFSEINLSKSFKKECEFFELQKQFKNIIFQNFNRNQIEDIIKKFRHELEDSIQKLSPYVNYPIGTWDSINEKDFFNELKQLFDDYFDEEIINNLNKKKFVFKKIYIPTLRGLRYLVHNIDTGINSKSVDINDFYEKTTINNYFLLKEDELQHNDKYKIFTGLKYYNILKQHLLGNYYQRELVSKYENYLSKTFFDNNKVTLIPKEGDQYIWIKIGNEEEKVIYDIGDGIQSIIIITLHLFLHFESIKDEENILILIEEPEQHLHPKLQKILLETMLDERFRYYQFFFTTHSNHFLDSMLNTDDVSVYSFEKVLTEKTVEETPKFQIKDVSTKNYSILNELGVLPSSVLVSNCDIFVEGPSDVKFYRRYLNIYQKENIEKNKDFKFFSEGYNFSFHIFGGSTLEFVMSESNEWEPNKKDNILFISDKDNDPENKSNLFNKYNCSGYVINCLEVENTVSKKTLINLLKNYPPTKKMKINELFREEKFKNYEYNDFIRKFAFINESGYQNINKKKFVDESLKYINSKNDLSDEARKIADKIYSFIHEKNTGKEFIIN